MNSYPGVISNDPGNEITYRSERHRAWRNVLVAGINALAASLFTIRPNDNRWPRPIHGGPSEGCVKFDLAPGLAAIAWLSDAGCGELNVGVLVNPSAETLRMGYGGDSLHWGDAVGRAWLACKRGAWLQSSPRRFACRPALQRRLTQLEVRPCCFGDRGNVIM